MFVSLLLSFACYALRRKRYDQQLNKRYFQEVYKMYKNRKNKSENIIQDDQLSQVTGGVGFEKGNSNRVYSGETPFYSVGDVLHIVYNRGFFKTAAICLCKVISVSDKKSGSLWLEFTYSVEIISAPANALEIDPNLVGMHVHDVYESALIREIRG